MHELGIVFHMIDLVEEVGRENGLASVSKVNLRLGQVTGVIPSYLLDCWRWAADKHEMLVGAELAVEEVEADTVCNACGKVYPTLEFGKTCPACGSEDTELLHGLEMELTSIETCDA